jgi:hypothetical protein
MPAAGLVPCFVRIVAMAANLPGRPHTAYLAPAATDSLNILRPAAGSNAFGIIVDGDGIPAPCFLTARLLLQGSGITVRVTLS